VTNLAEDIRWRKEHYHHPGLGSVGISQGEGNRIALALETTLSNIRDLAKHRAPVNVKSRLARAGIIAKR
jgi:hypothetical protein